MHTKPADPGIVPRRLQSVLKLRARLRPAMLRWYRRHRRELPWRDHPDPYVIWITEIMLQQTRVEQGTPYIERFLKAYPNVHALARARESSVLKMWEGLGYYSRARHLHRAAKIVSRDRQGEFPRTVDDWRELPGVGRYTAGAVVSISFNQPAPVLDGNVKRVLARIADWDRPIDQPKYTEMLWDAMAYLVVGKSPGDFNQSVMELGAQICRPRNPICHECPIRSLCRAHRKRTVDRRPVTTPKKSVPHRDIVVAVIQRRGRYLIGRRPPKGLLGGLWEFPGGKVEAGESHAEAVRREIREELGIGVSVGEKVATVKHAYSHFRVTLHVYRCEPNSAKPQAIAHTELKWVRRSEFERYAFPKANHKFLDRL